MPATLDYGRINNPGLVWVDRNGRQYWSFFHEFTRTRDGKIKIRIRGRWYICEESQVSRWPVE